MNTTATPTTERAPFYWIEENKKREERKARLIATIGRTAREAELLQAAAEYNRAGDAADAAARAEDRAADAAEAIEGHAHLIERDGFYSKAQASENRADAILHERAMRNALEIAAIHPATGAASDWDHDRTAAAIEAAITAAHAAAQQHRADAEHESREATENDGHAEIAGEEANDLRRIAAFLRGNRNAADAADKAFADTPSAS